MSYTALYRKFRPDTFADVKGQDHIVKTLKNQITADRIGHAYLFCGTRGTGKTTIAKIFAKAVNCEHPINGNPCNKCAACRAIAAGTSMNVIEIDAASNNGVDNIREIRDEVAYSPANGKYKVYIIDEVHMLSIGAFNALLKTLEEPPSYVIFILATTEAHKIPITILSRCQRYDFKRIALTTICDRLKDLMAQEGVEAEERAVRYIAKKADGSMRDALSLLDQCIAFYLGETLTYDNVLEVLGAVDTDVFSRMLRKVLDEDVTGVIADLEDLVMQGRDLPQFVQDFTWYLRNLLLIKTSDHMEEVLDVSTENLKQLQEEARMVRIDTLIRFIRIFSEMSGQIRYASSKRVLLEVALIKLCRPEMEQDTVSVLERVRRLEKKLEQGMIKAPSAPVDVSKKQSSETAEVQEKPEPVVYEHAAPEDLQRVKEQWKSIVEDAKGMFRYILASASVKYNTSDSQDTRLYVVFADFMGERYVNSQKAKDELEQLIANKIGKQVEVKMVLSADESLVSGQLGNVQVDEAIKKFVNIKVEIEDGGE